MMTSMEAARGPGGPDDRAAPESDQPLAPDTKAKPEYRVASSAKGKRRCTATTQEGEPCQAWARRGSKPALCVAHMDQAYGEGVAFYSAIMKREELIALADLAKAEVTLEGEIACTRVLLRRLIAHMNDVEPEGTVFLHFAKAVFRGTAAVAQLMKKEQELQAVSGEAGITAAIGQTLDELAVEWGFRDPED